MAKRKKGLLASVVVGVLALGWRYPLLGFVVPAVMAAGRSARKKRSTLHE